MNGEPEQRTEDERDLFGKSLPPTPKMTDPLPQEPSLPPERVCASCDDEKEWVDCWNCGGEGMSDHDCGEDCCCCLNPEDNVPCDVCDAAGGWYACRNCQPRAFDGQF